jgi:hypothetical protein
MSHIVGEQPQQVNININQTEPITCESCGNHTFQRVTLLRRVSPLVSPTGQSAIVPIALFACHACNHVNKEFLPKAPVENASTVSG